VSFLVFKDGFSVTTAYEKVPYQGPEQTCGNFVNEGLVTVNYDPLVFALRDRFGLDNIEMGAGILGINYADIKYSPLAQDSLFLPALDAIAYVDPGAENYGLGLGGILNIQPTQSFYFVTAAYIQYFFNNFYKILNVESSNNTDSFYTFTPGLNSYLYGGIEWQLGIIWLDFGVSYLILSKNSITFSLFGSEYNYFISNAFITSFGLKWVI